MKRNITIIVFFIFKIVFSQELHHQSICSQGGNSSTVDGYKIFQSIGQISQIGNYKSKSTIIQQGYQQNFFELGRGSVDLIECHIYPNPTKDIVIVSFDKRIKESYSLFLSDLTGKLISKWSNIDNKNYEISLKDLSGGTYILAIEMNNSRFYKKIIKQNEK